MKKLERSEETALAVKEPTALAEKDPYSMDDYTGIDELKVSLPYWKFDGKIGSFTHSLTEEEVKELAIVVLHLRYGNCLFAKISEIPPWICRSSDCLKGSMNPGARKEQYLHLGITGICPSCPCSQWVNSEKPLCQRNMSLLCVNRKDNIPFILTASGLSIKPWTKTLNASRALKRPPFANEINLGMDKEKNAKGSFFVQHPSLGVLVSIEEFGSYKAMWKELIIFFDAKMQEAPAEPTMPKASEDLGYVIEELPDAQMSVEDLPF